ncbi:MULTISPECIES: AAA family ATPase [Rhodococcus]|uniref:ATP-dependent endonuclease n=1 Tax=Rhodococcus qingshengii JCM 15477 TaxID=1303681 RepID=A0AB38RNF4_RHOSG|nr:MULTISPECIES: ATP-dependent endonuclease [Rhodococcus]MDA3637531.1 ATP-dependent endonuclease [Rhodococcus sp. C-2]UPU46655.1 ATP-dependent endonuclease [Rhodococcus qingshengii JCM 15477]
MRIKSVGIVNFRCLDNVEVDFSEITTFIGPNGAGKSSVLRALDWFFNGGKLDERDVWSGHIGSPKIRVRVTFTDLTDQDREALGPRYAPATASTFTAWRTWESGEDKMSGRAVSFPPFEVIRSATSAATKKTEYNALRDEREDLNLPKWTSAGNVDAVMDVWERDHPDRLSDTESGGTHLFGFNGQNKLSGLFDFVLVTADLRASEESSDGRGTIIGRILERTIDRGEADAEFAKLADEIAGKQAAINAEHLTGQLADLAKKLSAEVGSFTRGRSVNLQTVEPELKPQLTKIKVSIQDHLTETDVERQGHGFQRALLISSLKLLADHGTQDGSKSVICLAIEEPELFQHPTQARAFATVLRELASHPENNLQVTYATHSPYFVDERYFDQVRRVQRTTDTDSAHAQVQIRHATLESVVSKLNGYVKEDVVNSRWKLVCTSQLAEAFFSNATILVEGNNDRAIFEGIAARTTHLSIDGITIAAAQSKDHLYLPHAILSTLGIPVLTVFDNDSGSDERMRSGKKKPSDIRATTEKNKKGNRNLLRYLGLVEEDHPIGLLAPHVVAIPDTLESVLTNEWPEFEIERQKIVDNGQGVDGKNSLTYSIAAQSCSHDPTGIILNVITAARSLI